MSSIFLKNDFISKGDLALDSFKYILRGNKREFYKFIKSKTFDTWEMGYFTKLDFKNCPLFSEDTSSIENFYSSLNIYGTIKCNKYLLKEAKSLVRNLGFVSFSDNFLLENRYEVLRLYVFKSRIDMLKYQLLYIYFVPLVFTLFLVLNVLLFNIRKLMLG